MPVSTGTLLQISGKKRMNNNANTKISNCQATEKKSCWGMNRRHFLQRNEDQSIAKCCSNSKENVQNKDKDKDWLLINQAALVKLGQISLTSKVHGFRSLQDDLVSRRRRGSSEGLFVKSAAFCCVMFGSNNFNRAILN